MKRMQSVFRAQGVSGLDVRVRTAAACIPRTRALRRKQARHLDTRTRSASLSADAGTPVPPPRPPSTGHRKVTGGGDDGDSEESVDSLLSKASLECSKTYFELYNAQRPGYATWVYAGRRGSRRLAIRYAGRQYTPHCFTYTFQSC